MSHRKRVSQQNTRSLTMTTDNIGSHFNLFATQHDLSPGNHTLEFKIQNLEENGSVAIDYIIYNPSFDTIQDKPLFSFNYSGINSTTPDQGGSGAGSGDSGVDGSAGNASSGPNMGAIVGGGVAGGILFGAMIVLGIWLWCRRMSRKRIHQESQLQVQQPFTQRSPGEFS
jgi:hypothetical protein